MQKNTFNYLLVTLFFMSGFCNLVYEIVWSRMFGLVFGVTVFGVSAVLSSYMLGLAAGGFIFGRIVERFENRIRLFSYLHIGIFVSAAAIVVLFPFFRQTFLFINDILNLNFYLYRITVFILSLLILIVPTTLMGGTFPVISRIIAQQEGSLGKDIGLLYSVNTLGSVAGCIITIFVFLGSFGMNGSIFAAAFTDLLIGALLFYMSKKQFKESVKAV